MGSGAPDGAPDAAILSGTEAHKDKEPEQRKGKGKEDAKQASDKPTSPQKRGTPPIGGEQAAVPLITNSRQKISKKSLGVDLKKISEKFFGGMFRGKEKPLALSQRKGCSNKLNKTVM